MLGHQKQGEGGQSPVSQHGDAGQRREYVRDSSRIVLIHGEHIYNCKAKCLTIVRSQRLQKDFISPHPWCTTLAPDSSSISCPSCNMPLPFVGSSPYLPVLKKAQSTRATSRAGNFLCSPRVATLLHSSPCPLKPSPRKLRT